MKQFIYIFLLLFLSCKPEVKNETKSQNYTQDLLKKYDLDMDLPTLEFGEYLWKNDSANYVNVFILNDSTIRLEDSVYKLTRCIKDTFYGKTYEPRFKFNCYPVTKQIEINLKSSLKKNRVNVFMNQMDTMESLSSFNQSLTRKKIPENTIINIIGKNNLFVSTNHLYVDCDRYVIHSGGNYFLNILINKNNDIMIEGKWNQNIDSIEKHIKKWFSGESEDLPYLNKYNKKTIQLNIRNIKARIYDESKSNNSTIKLNKRLKKWEYYSKTHSLIGDFNTINKYDEIVIQYDRQVEYKSYVKIVEYCNKGLVSLKNEFCLNKFGVTYSSLYPLDSSQNEIKEAIDFVYPNIIIPLFHFPPPEVPLKYRN